MSTTHQLITFTIAVPPDAMPRNPKPANFTRPKVSVTMTDKQRHRCIAVLRKSKSVRAARELIKIRRRHGHVFMYELPNAGPLPDDAMDIFKAADKGNWEAAAWLLKRAPQPEKARRQPRRETV